MLRICGKRLIVVALALIGAGCMEEQVSREPAFARITLSENSAVYVQIQGGEVRAAMSAEGLQTAQPVSAHTEFTLPIPAEQLPAGVTAIKANLALMQMQTSASAAPAPYLDAGLTFCRKDGQKVEWQYVLNCRSPTAASAVNAPPILLPNLDKLNAQVTAAPSGGKLGIGVTITGDNSNVALTDVRKDGKPVEVKMVVTDASGAEIASRVGTLADFGFS